MALKQRGWRTREQNITWLQLMKDQMYINTTFSAKEMRDHHPPRNMSDLCVSYATVPLERHGSPAIFREYALAIISEHLGTSMSMNVSLPDL